MVLEGRCIDIFCATAQERGVIKGHLLITASAGRHQSPKNHA
jgi:hypothetical protein